MLRRQSHPSQPSHRRRRWGPILLRTLGVAGLAGVAATGVLVARDQRRRAELTPDEVRERLRARYAEAAEAPTGTTAAPESVTRDQLTG